MRDTSIKNTLESKSNVSYLYIIMAVLIFWIFSFVLSYFHGLFSSLNRGISIRSIIMYSYSYKFTPRVVLTVINYLPHVQCQHMWLLKIMKTFVILLMTIPPMYHMIKNTKLNYYEIKNVFLYVILNQSYRPFSLLSSSISLPT